MTIQDLKNNRTQIIEELNYRFDNNQSFVKEVMQSLVNMIGYRGIKSTDTMSYVEEVISMLDLQSKFDEIGTTEAFRSLEEQNIARSKNLMQHI